MSEETPTPTPPATTGPPTLSIDPANGGYVWSVKSGPIRRAAGLTIHSSKTAALNDAIECGFGIANAVAISCVESFRANENALAVQAEAAAAQAAEVEQEGQGDSEDETLTEDADGEENAAGDFH